MGILVSFLSTPSSSDENSQRPAPAPNIPRASQSPPQYITLPPTLFGSAALSSSSPSRASDDPFASPLYSPALEMYHTAPSTPIASPSIEVPSAAAHQRAAESPGAKLHIMIPAATPNDPSAELPIEDAFPTAEIPMDLVDDEGLSALEKIYLFARSQSVLHRLFIVHALPSFLQQVTPQEAIEYVLPLIPGLAMDEDEKVKEALVAELVPVIWWFFTHCQVIPDDLGVEETVYSSSTSTISVQAFTPILGTLLLSPNSKVGGGARYVVVNILARMRKLDKRESDASPSSLVSGLDSDSDDGDSIEDLPVGLFGHEERLMFEQELLQQVVIGMGRLDIDAEDDVDLDPIPVGQQTPGREAWTIQHVDDAAIQVANMEQQVTPEYQVVSSHQHVKPVKTSPTTEVVSSYFPVLPSYSVPSPGSSNSSTPSSSTDTSSTSSSASPVVGPPALAAQVVQRHTSDEPSLRPSRPPSKPASPHVETPPNPSPPSSSPTSSPRQKLFYLSGASSETGTDDHGTEGTDDGEGDQAAVGRLSSMSLMAAVAANGCLDDATKQAFVREVERVGHDPVYWVRREASYALGALAKVVPDEIVMMSLIPLFDTLRRDSQWHVRSSALFALPAILARLTPAKRRKLALDTILPLSIDDSQTVRSGALESLGEVLYTFHDDPDGPPEELVQLFLGRREDKRVRDGQQAAQHREQVLNSLFGRSTTQSTAVGTESPLTSFYTDPARPLICAFNYPAVALTLGREQWGKLRDTYLEIAENREVAVRRTLAASLGELAKIIGTKNSERDLLGIWWDTVRSEEEEVREKALESAELFVATLGKKAQITVVSGLLSIWQEGIFRGWRERKTIARALAGFATSMGHDDPHTVRSLLQKALGDGVAAVREAAILTLPRLWSMFSTAEDVLAGLREDIRALSRSEVYRHRMTFVACLQSLLNTSDRHFITSEDILWSTVPALADDAVVGVRIGIARLVRVASEQSQTNHQPVSAFLLDLIRHLSLDSSPDVQAYVRDCLTAAPTSNKTPVETRRAPRRPKLAIFSRPPPASLHSDTAPQDEIRQGLTRSAKEDDAISSQSPTSTVNPPQEGNPSPVPGKPAPQERLLSPSDPKFVPVPA